MNMSTNVAMCAELCSLLVAHPQKQALMRSCGTVGFAAFEEALLRDNVYTCVEMVDTVVRSDDIEDVNHVPIKASRIGDVVDNYVVISARLSSSNPSSMNLPPLPTFLTDSNITLRTSSFVEAFAFVKKYSPAALRLVDDSRVGSSQSVVPANFLKGRLLKSISFENHLCLSNVTHLGNSFLALSSNLTYIDLTPFTALVAVGDSFLGGCSKLKTLNLAPLHRVRVISRGFLRDCTELHSVDFSSLTNVKEIADGFMDSACCVGPTHIDISSMRSLKTIGEHFLSYCVGVEQVSFPRGVVLEQSFIPRRFLVLCRSLKAIDLSMFAAVTSVRESFLEVCMALTHIDLTPLSQVTDIKEKFLANCNSLTSVDVTPLSKLTSLPSCFLMACSSIENLDFKALTSVGTVGHSFLMGCRQLKTVEFAEEGEKEGERPVPVHEIGDHPFEGCASLTKLDLRFLASIVTVPSHFAVNCASLRSLDFSPLAFVRQLSGERFLYGCVGLQELNLSFLSNVSAIPRFFLAKCPALLHLDLSQLNQVLQVDEEGFLAKHNPELLVVSSASGALQDLLIRSGINNTR